VKNCYKNTINSLNYFETFYVTITTYAFASRIVFEGFFLAKIHTKDSSS